MQRVLGMEWVVPSWDWAHVRHVALTKMLREQRLHGFHEAHRSADQLGRRLAPWRPRELIVLVLGPLLFGRPSPPSLAVGAGGGAQPTAPRTDAPRVTMAEGSKARWRRVSRAVVKAVKEKRLPE